jgi:hypothetical protein
MFMAFIFFMIFFNVEGELSKLGSLYLNNMKAQYSWLKDSIKYWGIPKGIDPSYCVALFGIISVSGNTYLNSFRKAFTIPSSGGGCGDFGCGGCGGGGCGGGCGGCGG